MHRYNVIRFKPEHLDEIKLRPEQKDDILGTPLGRAVAPNLVTGAARTKYGIPACDTLLIDGKPVCAFGIIEHYPGICEGWGYFSEDVKGHGKFVLSTLKRVVNDCVFTRLQTGCREDFTTSRRMLESVGFNCEAILKKATPDAKDFCIYSIVR